MAKKTKTKKNRRPVSRATAHGAAVTLARRLHTLLSRRRRR